MSVRLIRAAEQDDAAFRARLAPLASEVLPTPPTVAPRPRTPLFARRIVVILGVAVTLFAVAGAAWWFSGARHPTGVRLAEPIAQSGSSTPQAFTQPASPPAHAIEAKATPTQSPADNDMINLLLRRGNAALADGDIIAARLLFEQAARMGSAAAATATGKTYDAEFLAQSGAHGIRPDQAVAATWFRAAAALGDGEASAQLARIEGQPRP